MLREMRGPEGGFYRALDADSEGIEGRFYVWSTRELDELLGEDAAAAISWLGATEQGKFQDPSQSRGGLNVLTERGALPTRRAPSGSARAPADRARAARAPRARRQAPDELERADDLALAEAGAAVGCGNPSL